MIELKTILKFQNVFSLFQKYIIYILSLSLLINITSYKGIYFCMYCSLYSLFSLHYYEEDLRKFLETFV